MSRPGFRAALLLLLLRAPSSTAAVRIGSPGAQPGFSGPGLTPSFSAPALEAAPSLGGWDLSPTPGLEFPLPPQTQGAVPAGRQESLLISPGRDGAARVRMPEKIEEAVPRLSAGRAAPPDREAAAEPGAPSAVEAATELAEAAGKEGGAPALGRAFDGRGSFWSWSANKLTPSELEGIAAVTIVQDGGGEPRWLRRLLSQARDQAELRAQLEEYGAFRTERAYHRAKELVIAVREREANPAGLAMGGVTKLLRDRELEAAERGMAETALQAAGLDGAKTRGQRLQALLAEIGEGVSLIDALAGEAMLLAQVRYLVEVERRVVRLLARYFPDFARRYPYSLVFQLNSGASLHGRSEAGQMILLRDETIHRHVGEDELAPTSFQRGSPSVPGRDVPKRISLLMRFFHEFAHGVFEEIVMPGPRVHVTPGGDSLYLLISEGFALHMETQLIERLLADPDSGLAEGDAAYLREYRRQRESLNRVYRKLEGEARRYPEGLRLFRRIFRSGGDAGVMRFLRGLDGTRLKSLLDSSPEFLLARNSIRRLRAFLAAEGSPGPN